MNLSFHRSHTVMPAVLAFLATASAQILPPLQAKVDFERDIAPIFQRKCYACHGPSQETNGLRLDVKTAALAADSLNQ